MADLKTQQDMGAISVRTVIEQSPYTTDVALELERLDNEKNDSEADPEQADDSPTPPKKENASDDK